MSKELNHTARDSLMGQITTAMESLVQKRESLNSALHLYEQARNSSLSEPLDHVQAILEIVSKKLDQSTHKDSKKSQNLANLAREIKESESEA
jgi:hypothetical protein